MMTFAQSIIDKIIQLEPELTMKYSVRSIGLFGSVVRDDFSPGKSDVDILVDFSRPVGIEFVDLAQFLESQLNYKIDLVSLHGIKKQYLEKIQKDIRYVWQK
jgi:predicted nucleotidyltransferase